MQKLAIPRAASIAKKLACRCSRVSITKKLFCRSSHASIPKKTFFRSWVAARTCMLQYVFQIWGGIDIAFVSGPLSTTKKQMLAVEHSRQAPLERQRRFVVNRGGLVWGHLGGREIVFWQTGKVRITSKWKMVLYRSSIGQTRLGDVWCCFAFECFLMVSWGLNYSKLVN